MRRDRYILHYAPDNASLVVRLALEELSLPYETRLVDRSVMAQRKAEYLALNLNGLIPTLETDDGVMFETAAILLWLSDRHGHLAPAMQSADRAYCLKWLFFMSNTLHVALRHMFYPTVYVGDDVDACNRLRNNARQKIGTDLQILDTAFAKAPPYPILKLYLAPMLRWLVLYPKDYDKSWFALARYPALKHIAKEQEKRASTQAAILAEGLGPRPFTAPQLPSPPEGSAL